MTFSYSQSGLADVVRRDIKTAPESSLPSSLREFMVLAVQALKDEYGIDTVVNVSASGHAGQASINIQRGEPVVEAPPQPAEVQSGAEPVADPQQQA